MQKTRDIVKVLHLNPAGFDQASSSLEGCLKGVVIGGAFSLSEDPMRTFSDP